MRLSLEASDGTAYLATVHLRRPKFNLSRHQSPPTSQTIHPFSHTRQIKRQPLVVHNQQTKRSVPVLATAVEPRSLAFLQRVDCVHLLYPAVDCNESVLACFNAPSPTSASGSSNGHTNANKVHTPVRWDAREQGAFP